MTASSALIPDRPPPALQSVGESLTTATAAELLGCTPRTVTNLITRGHLPASRLPGRAPWRISPAALLAFAERHGLHDPGAVAATTSPDQLPDFRPAPALLLETRTADGLRVVTPYRPPDPGQQDG